MATVCHPGSGRVSASFAAVAGHYPRGVKICPPRRGQRKGVVEKANHTAAQRWWRTLADEVSPAAAQADLDRFCARVGDARTRRDGDGERVTVAALAATEPLLPVPRRRTRRPSASPARCPRRRWWRSAATPTPSRPGWSAGS